MIPKKLKNKCCRKVQYNNIKHIAFAIDLEVGGFMAQFFLSILPDIRIKSQRPTET